MALIHADGRPVSAAEVSRAKAQANADLNRPNEAARRKGVFMNQWRPGLRSADADWLGDRNDVVARARDVGRNEPVGGAALHRRLNSAVGFGWRLSSKPNARALGVSYEVAFELGRRIEIKWKAYAEGVLFTADAERQLTFGQLLRLAASHIFQDGEALGLVEWAADEPTLFKTRLRVVDPDRLSNPNGKPDSPTLRGGVEKTETGIPVRYWIREGHPSDLGGVRSLVWKGWDRYATTRGRPQVLHAFDKLRAGQSRGVTRLVQALKAFRAFGKFTDATLEAATLNALFLGFVKSNAGPSAVKEGFEADDVASWAEERAEFYEENPVTVAGSQLQVLGLDDEVQMQTTARDTSGFDAFSRSILRLIAASLGVTYEELSMDFSQANYSSARAAMLIAWNETLALRALLKAQWVQPFFVAWLEEAFDNGELELPEGAPDFHDARDAYAECRWIGPARGYIDPTKEIEAATMRIDAGISTLEDEVAELEGGDWEDKLEQKARERLKREELGEPESSARPARDPAAEAAADQARDARP